MGLSSRHPDILPRSQVPCWHSPSLILSAFCPLSRCHVAHGHGRSGNETTSACFLCYIPFIEVCHSSWVSNAAAMRNPLSSLDHWLASHYRVGMPGVLATASLASGLMSSWCPPPGPAFMMVLLAQGLGMMLVGAGGGGEWRATAALVTSTASLQRVGLLLLENGAAVGPVFEVCTVHKEY